MLLKKTPYRSIVTSNYKSVDLTGVVWPRALYVPNMKGFWIIGGYKQPVFDMVGTLKRTNSTELIKNQMTERGPKYVNCFSFLNCVNMSY